MTREYLIRKGFLTPAPAVKDTILVRSGAVADGDPSPNVHIDLPTLPIDVIGRREVRQEINDIRMGRFDRKGR